MKSSLKPALIISVIGIFLLFFISNKASTPVAVEINNISAQHINKTLSIRGIVFSEKHNKETSTFLVSENNKTLEIICFCQHTYINRTITAIGNLEVYNNKTRLVAEKIDIIKN